MSNTEDNDPIRLGIDTKTVGRVESSQTGTLDPAILKKKLGAMPFAKGFKPKIISIKTQNKSPGERYITVTFQNPEADWQRLSFTSDDIATTGTTITNTTLS